MSSFVSAFWLLAIAGMPIILFLRSPPLWSLSFLKRFLLGIAWVWVMVAASFWTVWLLSPKSAISRDNLLLAQGATWMGWLPGLYYAIPLVGIKTVGAIWKIFRAGGAKRKPEGGPGADYNRDATPGRGHANQP